MLTNFIARPSDWWCRRCATTSPHVVTRRPAKFRTSTTGQYVSHATSGKSSTGCPPTVNPSSSISSRNLSSHPGSVRPSGAAARLVSSSKSPPRVRGPIARNSQNNSVLDRPNPSKAPARNNAIASSHRGSARRQKSAADPNGGPPPIRPSNPSDNPLIMHSGTRISPVFPPSALLFPASTTNFPTSPFTQGRANAIPSRRASIV